MMDKPIWKKIDKSSSKPCPRWGHTCCVIGEQVVFFGGYADSNYMNDVRTYNATTTCWEEIVTIGQKPSLRSNCSMNYDPVNDHIVIFGGGGPNKQRFHTISILDWKNKEWTEIMPKENEAAPWEKTYHTAQVKFPYLVVFGGEGVADLDDLWLFDFNTLAWREVKLNKQAVRPCARRFHSSVLIGNQMFIIAGCHGKYRCLSDVYSLDLTPLLQTGKTTHLQWVDRKIRGVSFLSRWGHSSAVFDNKIYVFADRFSNDLNDLLVIDTQTSCLRALNIAGALTDIPKARRRHCAGFVGSCMVAFGGFNGQYFNDLHYINVFQLTNKVDLATPIELLQQMVNNIEQADDRLISNNGQNILVHIPLLARYLKQQKCMRDYLEQITNIYDGQQLIHCWYGKLDENEVHQRYGVRLPQSYNRKMFVNLIMQEQDNSTNVLKKAHLTAQKVIDPILYLKRNEFQAFIQLRHSHWSCDSAFILNRNKQIPVNRLLLSIQSVYFSNLFSRNYSQQKYVHISFQQDYSIAINVLINYLMTGMIVVPHEFTNQYWMNLAELSHYFAIAQLKNICEGELCRKVTVSNMNQLQNVSIEMSSLCTIQLKNCLKQNEMQQCLLKKAGTCNKSSLMKLYQTIRFDLNHSLYWQGELKDPLLRRKNMSQIIQQEKENRQCNNL